MKITLHLHTGVPIEVYTEEILMVAPIPPGRLQGSVITFVDNMQLMVSEKAEDINQVTTGLRLLLG